MRDWKRALLYEQGSSDDCSIKGDIFDVLGYLDNILLCAIYKRVEIYICYYD